MTPESYRLIHRVEPYEHEMLDGFLARVTERNHLLAAHHLQELLTGSKTSAITPNDIPRIAHYCRNSVEEIYQLSGIEKHIGHGKRVWQVAGEWVSKSSFVSLRRGKVCPICLADAGYVRGYWALTFYNACAQHDAHLVDRCPACTRSLKWSRRRARYCGCGFDLARSPTSTADSYQLLVAKLMAHRAHPEIAVNPHLLGHVETSRLMELSLDGLCRTIWFLGHCVGELGNYGVGHGLRKPKPLDADVLIARACILINRWPNNLGDKIQQVLEQYSPQHSVYFLNRVLQPITHYLRDAIDTQELSFLRLAYEQHLSHMSRSLRHYDNRASGYQMELDF